MKYKCLDCGNVFEGDISTQKCPQCQSDNIKKDGSKLPWKKILTTIAIVGVAGLIISLIVGGDSKIESSLSSDNRNVYLTLEGPSEKEIREKYKIVYSSPNDSQKDLYFGNQGRAMVDISTLMEGEIYTFNIVERKTSLPVKEPNPLHWTTSRQYQRPLPPTPPQISVETVADCHSGTYTVTIKINDGYADEFVLDAKKQTSPVFTGVQGRKDDYFATAIDTKNGLTSERVNVSCPVITPFHVTEQVIQDVFRKVGRRELKVGDAMKKICNGQNMKLSQQIDGNRSLEAALNYAYANEIQYSVQATIIHDDCSDKVSNITITK